MEGRTMNPLFSRVLFETHGEVEDEILRGVVSVHGEEPVPLELEAIVHLYSIYLNFMCTMYKCLSW